MAGFPNYCQSQQTFFKDQYQVDLETILGDSRSILFLSDIDLPLIRFAMNQRQKKYTFLLNSA